MSTRRLVLSLVLANVLAWSVAWSLYADWRGHHAYHLAPTELVCMDAAGWLVCAT